MQYLITSSQDELNGKDEAYSRFYQYAQVRSETLERYYCTTGSMRSQEMGTALIQCTTGMPAETIMSIVCKPGVMEG